MLVLQRSSHAPPVTRRACALGCYSITRNIAFSTLSNGCMHRAVLCLPIITTLPTSSSSRSKSISSSSCCLKHHIRPKAHRSAYLTCRSTNRSGHASNSISSSSSSSMIPSTSSSQHEAITTHQGTCTSSSDLRDRSTNVTQPGESQSSSSSVRKEMEAGVIGTSSSIPTSSSSSSDLSDPTNELRTPKSKNSGFQIPTTATTPTSTTSSSSSLSDITSKSRTLKGRSRGSEKVTATSSSMGEITSFSAPVDQPTAAAARPTTTKTTSSVTTQKGKGNNDRARRSKSASKSSSSSSSSKSSSDGGGIRTRTGSSSSSSSSSCNQLSMELLPATWADGVPWEEGQWISNRQWQKDGQKYQDHHWGALHSSAVKGLTVLQQHLSLGGSSSSMSGDGTHAATAKAGAMTRQAEAAAAAGASATRAPATVAAKTAAGAESSTALPVACTTTSGTTTDIQICKHTLVQLQARAQGLISGRFSALLERIASKGPKYKLFYMDFELNGELQCN